MITIRPLTLQDTLAYYALRLRALSEHPEAFGSSLEETEKRGSSWAEQRIEDALHNGGVILGAFTVDEKLVGMAGLQPETRQKSRHRGVIWGVHVAREKQGQGIGRRLLEQLLDHAGQIPALEQLMLNVVTSNAPAVHLYRSLGFEIYGTEPRALKLGEIYYDEYLMWKKLR